MFDRDYFDSIWGTVHRHDYCETFADNLIRKYGVGRYLDIGTGCGFLVKVLRDKGCEAYGLEISKYAVDNSHGNVLQGSVLDIPFKDNSFDVVCSNGLWTYLEKSDVQHAWMECNRVGKHQEHNIDTTQDVAEWAKDFTIYEPIEWWNEHLKLPKILVACPTHLVKDYSMQRWIDNVKSFTYPNLDILLVDNSPHGEMIAKYGDQVKMIKLPAEGIEDLVVTRINRSMEVIRQEFLQGDYAYWCDIEIDVIPPSNAIELLLKYGKDSDWIAHAYPARNSSDNQLAQQGIGLCLLSRKLLENFSFKDSEDSIGPDAWLWDRVRPQAEEYPTVELWGHLPNVKHLSD